LEDQITHTPQPHAGNRIALKVLEDQITIGA
jgi:hypothetical protein